MEFEIPIRYREETLCAAIRQFWMRAVGRKVAWGVFAAAGLLGILRWTKTPIWTLNALGASVGLALLYFPFVFWRFRKKTRAFFRKMPAQEVTLKLTDEGILTQSTFGTSTTSWQKVIKVWRFPEVWLVFHAKDRFFTIPTRDLPAKAAEFLVKKVSIYGKDVS